MKRKIPKWVLPLFGAMAGILINNFFSGEIWTGQDRGAPFCLMAIFLVIQLFGTSLMTISLLSLGSIHERANKSLEQRP